MRELIVAEKQLVEIAKALQRDARVLIMDEPTATLTPGETERLFALIAQLKAEGVTVVYISHKLDEVERVTDEVVVMRDGRFVARELTARLTRRQMANLMVGRELSDLYPATRICAAVGRAAAARGEDLSVPGWARDVSFEVAPGEILGFAGWSAPAAPRCSRACWACVRARRCARDRRRPLRIRNPREAAAMA